MNIYKKKIYQLVVQKIKRLLFFPYDFFLFIKVFLKMLNDGKKSGFPIVSVVPIIGNNRLSAGSIDRHYFLQDIYMAQKIREFRPEMHYDIGSRVDGFIAHLLCDNIKVTMMDIRPLPQHIEGLSFIQADATSLDGIVDGSIRSLSSLHAVEHFGLTRYGDYYDLDASRKAMREIQRVVEPGGHLFFSVPISYRNAIIYNSHRVFKPEYIIEQFNEMELISFAYIRDYMINEYYGQDAKRIICENSFYEYDCGMFVFVKPKKSI